MAHLTRPIDARGAVVMLRVGLTRRDVKSRRAAGRPVGGFVEVPALIDTGANASAVDPYIARILDLDPVDYAPLHTPSGAAAGEYPVYEIQLAFAESEIRGDLGIVEVLGCESLSANGYLMLLGRDVLDLGHFTYDGPAGTFTLDY